MRLQQPIAVIRDELHIETTRGGLTAIVEDGIEGEATEHRVPHGGDLVGRAVGEEALKATGGRRVREAEEAVAGAGEVEP